MSTTNEQLWGIDLGGTKIEGVVLRPGTPPTVDCRIRIPTEADKGYHHILSQIQKLVGLMTKETGAQPKHIGIGTPGALDPFTNTLKNSNSTCLNGQPFKKDLQNLLELPVTMTNDANCFALAEALLGAVPEKNPNASVVFGVIMGTGVGGGIVINGQALNGNHSIAGEWGHNFLDASGGPCYCGKIGCVETLISGPGLQRYYEQVSGKKLSLKEIHQAYQEGNDVHAEDTMKRLIHFFGMGISSIVNMLDPDVIVIGGGVGNIDLLYTEGVASVSKHVFNPELNTPIIKPKLGDSAGVFGAALLTQNANN